MANALPPNLEALRGLATPIADDRPCRRCSYNLKGLQPGQRCPECGTPIGGVPSRRRGELTYGEVPLDFLRAMRLASALALVGGPGGVVAMGLLLLVTTASPAVTNGMLMIASLGFLAWGVGVAMLHSPLPSLRTDTRRSANFWWRWSNRLLGFAPLAACLLVLAATNIHPALSPLCFVAAAVAGVLAAAGFISICHYASLLCMWLGDDGTADQFRIACLLTVFGGGLFGPIFLGLLSLAFTAWRGVGFFSLVAIVVSGLLTLRTCWGSLNAMWSLHQLFRWAIRNRFESMDSAVRVAERIQARIAENQSDEARKKGRHIGNR